MSMRRTGNGNSKPQLRSCDCEKKATEFSVASFQKLPRLLQSQGRHHAGCGLAPFETSLPGVPLFDGPNPLGAIRSSNSSTLSSCASSTSRSFFILLHQPFCSVLGSTFNWSYLRDGPPGGRVSRS